MRNALYITLILIVFLSNCTKKKDFQAEISETSVSAISETVAPVTNEISKIMYVNSPEGLRVRNSPDLSGERIGVLADNTEVLVIKEDEKNVIIEGIGGKWAYIETENIRGWIFGGFLQNKPVKKTELIIGNTLKDFTDYFFDDIPVNNYINDGTNNIEDLLTRMNTIGEYKYIITERESLENRHDPSAVIDVYTIEGGPHKIIVNNISHYNKLNFLSFEIKLNEENYLNSFPYKTMEEYMQDNNFGEIYTSGDRNDGREFIRYPYYYDSDNVCELLFQNGLLCGIRYVPNFP